MRKSLIYSDGGRSRFPSGETSAQRGDAYQLMGQLNNAPTLIVVCAWGPGISVLSPSIETHTHTMVMHPWTRRKKEDCECVFLLSPRRRKCRRGNLPLWAITLVSSHALSFSFSLCRRPLSKCLNRSITHLSLGRKRAETPLRMTKGGGGKKNAFFLLRFSLCRRLFFPCESRNKKEREGDSHLEIQETTSQHG